MCFLLLFCGVQTTVRVFIFEGLNFRGYHCWSYFEGLYFHGPLKITGIIDTEDNDKNGLLY